MEECYLLGYSLQLVQFTFLYTLGSPAQGWHGSSTSIMNQKIAPTDLSVGKHIIN